MYGKAAARSAISGHASRICARKVCSSVMATTVSRIVTRPLDKLSATLGLIEGAAQRLVAGGLLLIYSPFNEESGFTGPGNAAFDSDLRRRNPELALRDREAVDATALAHGFVVDPVRNDHPKLSNADPSRPSLRPLDFCCSCSVTNRKGGERKFAAQRKSVRRGRVADIPLVAR